VFLIHGRIYMSMTHKIKYGVNDLGQATALICAGFEVIDLTPNPDSDRVTFYFKPSERIAETTQLYWSGKLTVDAKQYWQEMKNLKTRLYSLR
jgi:hypothetical protein